MSGKYILVEEDDEYNIHTFKTFGHAHPHYYHLPQVIIREGYTQLPYAFAYQYCPALPTAYIVGANGQMYCMTHMENHLNPYRTVLEPQTKFLLCHPRSRPTTSNTILLIEEDDDETTGDMVLEEDDDVDATDEDWTGATDSTAPSNFNNHKNAAKGNVYRAKGGYLVEEPIDEDDAEKTC